MNNSSENLNIGKAGEHLVAFDLLVRGIPTSLSSQGSTYDLLVEIENKILRVQVKTTRQKRMITKRANAIYFFHIKRTGKNSKKLYKTGDFEMYALVALDSKKVFYLPFNQAKSSSICVRDRDADYGGKRGGGRPNGIYLQDLTLENCIKNLKIN